MCYTFIMKFKNYFKNLSKTYSGNYIAMIGFVVFIFTVLGVISRFIQGIIFGKSSIIKGISASFIGETCFYLPITCVLAIIPLIILFKFLLKPIYSLKTQILFILLSVLLFTSGNLFALDYTYQGAGIYFPFVFVIGLPILIVMAIIFVVLLCLDIIKHPNIKNKELITNRCYIKLVNIFYCYALFSVFLMLVIIALD